jgi:hypothetical protein
MRVLPAGLRLGRGVKSSLTASGSSGGDDGGLTDAGMLRQAAMLENPN